ncbi:MAG: hypothetical protein WDZ83_19270 [Rhizobiaceae bacterium]
MADYASAHTPAGDDRAERRFAGLAEAMAAAIEASTLLVIAVTLVATPLLLHLLNPAAGIAAAVVLAGACAWRMPKVAIVAIVFSFLFQNLIVSLIADHIRDADDFDVIRGYNFLVLSAVWLTTAIRFIGSWTGRDRALDPYLKFTVAVMAVIGIYFIVGYARTGITAVVYLRNIVTPLLFFQICLVVFARQTVRIGPALSALAVLTIICGFTEFLARDFWLAVTNGQAYWDVGGGANWMTLAFDKAAKETGLVATSLTDTFKIAFFNSPLLADLQIEVMRLFGPNMHAISFAYALAFFCVFSLYRGRFGLAALLFVLMVLTNAKGPLIMFILVGGGWVVFRLFGAYLGFAAMCLALAAYAVMGVIIGLDIEDYHVLGLMAGLLDFPTQPIGWGIGSGGNLSPDFATIDWSAAQGAGRTPFAVESSVAVLLHQIGIFALAVISLYVWIAWRLMKLARTTQNDLHAAAALGLMGIVVNGLFQEEAYFAPLALAMYLGLAGMILGAAIRNGVLEPDGEINS